VKMDKPDVFFVVGYSGDNVQIARQAQSLGVKPNLMLIIAAGGKREDFGDFGDGISVIGEWAPEQKSEGNAAFVARATSELPPGTKILPAVVQGYTGMYTLIEAIRRAGALDRAKVLAELDKGKFATPYGELSYRTSEHGGKHQLLSDANLIVWQYRKSGQEVVWPPAKANGKLVYPAK
jgi:branched-chain amino acid transport system substrate-binding protein